MRADAETNKIGEEHQTHRMHSGEHGQFDKLGQQGQSSKIEKERRGDGQCDKQQEIEEIDYDRYQARVPEPEFS